jgi:hypothetical protein
MLTSTLWQQPHTRLGWWAVGLTITCISMFIFNAAVFLRLTQVNAWQQVPLSIFQISILVCGVASGITGAIAIIRKHERSWMLWLTLFPGAFVIFLILGEFLIPHG